ncbi:DUF1211 domain-containing protein [Oenococcus sp. UCMA 14587]|nr:DUF1211 domain-containing protein [Oenococcus sp. UCMA 14587]
MDRCLSKGSDFISKNRLEAFSDGVFAIIITIMVLDLKIPAGSGWSELIKPRFVNTLLAYLLSFLFVVSFWISHHTIITPVQIVDKTLLWFNVVLLSAISLLPLVTAWHGEYPNSVAPSFSYLFIYVLSVFCLYLLGVVATKRVKSENREFFQRTNKIRLCLVLSGIFASFLTLIYPLIASFSVFAILLFWLVFSSWQENISKV